MSKCQIWKDRKPCDKEAEWAWQPFGPNDDYICFTLLGSHYRGFPVIKVCWSCKADILLSWFDKSAHGVQFNYKHKGFCVYQTTLKELPF